MFSQACCPGGKVIFMMSLPVWLPGLMFFLGGERWDVGPPPSHRQTPPGTVTTGGHCSGRYASYWNAFV